MNTCASRSSRCRSWNRATLKNGSMNWIRRVPQDAWLGGWSLGGMLASELAARRGDRCCGLLTLASNPCFVAHEQWPSAMPGETFDAFLAGCNADPRMTLKRFSLLCAQGAEDPRGLSRLLLGGAPHTSAAVLMSGLELLAQLDTRQALQAFRGPQLHLFAGLDGLVPGRSRRGLAGVAAGCRNRPDRTGRPRVSSGRPPRCGGGDPGLFA